MKGIRNLFDLFSGKKIVLNLLIIAVLQACAGGDLLQRSAINYPVQSSLETGRQDPVGTLNMSFSGSGVSESGVNRFHLREAGQNDTTHMFTYYPEYFASFRMQYAYPDNLSPSLLIFAAAPSIEPLSEDTLFQHIPKSHRTLYGFELGIPSYEEYPNGFALAFRLAFRFTEDTYITKRTQLFNQEGYLYKEEKRTLIRIPLEFIANYKITPTTELIGGVKLNSIFFSNVEGFRPNWLSYKFGLKAQPDSRWNLTAWCFFDDPLGVVYDNSEEMVTDTTPVAPYIGFQLGYRFHMDNTTR